MCVRLWEDEVLDTLVQRRRDGRAAPRMIRKLLKKQRRRRNRKFADSALERTGFEISVPVRQAKLTRSCR
jgi:transposase-like protein